MAKTKISEEDKLLKKVLTFRMPTVRADGLSRDDLAFLSQFYMVQKRYHNRTITPELINRQTSPKLPIYAIENYILRLNPLYIQEEYGVYSLTNKGLNLVQPETNKVEFRSVHVNKRIAMRGWGDTI